VIAATDLLLVRSGVFPPFSESQAYTDTLLAIALTYRTLYGVVAAYLTARLAPQRPMLHACALGSIGLLLAIVGVVFVVSAATAWYALALVMVALPAAWKFAGSRHRTRTEQHCSNSV
jgi:peptidoglycan/LPS O-acetylase OafA/YrhL